ncbi:MAG: trypsin-like peptidase domain-containing protein [Planctomycetota bacterium]
MTNARRVAWPLLSSVFVLLAPAAAQEALPAEAVERLKAGAAFLRVSVNEQLYATGSGFLVSRHERGGFLVTNFHVIQAALEGGTVEAVLRAGTPAERRCPAKLVAVDGALDLALLELTGEGLPAPLTLEDAEPPRETLPVYVVGFPLGEALAARDRNPRPTISRASVASLRQTPQGPVIQLDGELNPGNSGGPIVDPKTGKLLGVAVAKVEGTNIGFAIPARAVLAFLRGRVTDLELEQSLPGPEGAVLLVRARLVDPHGEVARCELRVAPVTSETAAPHVGPADAEVQGQGHALQRKGDALEARIQLAPQQVAERYRVQTAVVRKDGSRGLGPVGVLEPHVPGRVGQLSVIDLPDLGDRVVADPAGGGVFVLLRDPERPAQAQVVLFDLLKRAVVTRIQVPLAPSDLALVGDRLVVCCPDSGVVVVVDPAQRKVVRAVEVEAKRRGKAVPPRRVCEDSPPGTAVVLCTEGDEDRYPVLAALDLATGAVTYTGERSAERLCFSGEHALVQDNFGGFPSGVPVAAVTSAVLAPLDPRQPYARQPVLRAPWESRNGFGPAHAIPGGFVVSSHEGTTTAWSFAGGQGRALWSAPGVLCARYRGLPVVCVSRTSVLEAAVEGWPLQALDARSGKPLWELSLRLPQPVSPQLERAVLLATMPNVLVNAPWELRDWAQATSPWSVGRGTIARQGGKDWLVFSLSGWRPTGSLGGRVIRFEESRRGWVIVALPPLSRQEGEAPREATPPRVAAGPPPSTLRVGETLDWVVPAERRPGETFVLLAGPSGLSVDPQTGRLRWTPEPTALGKHRVQVALEVAGQRRTVLEHVLRVTGN